jgi:hypothetical protein
MLLMIGCLPELCNGSEAAALKIMQVKLCAATKLINTMHQQHTVFPNMYNKTWCALWRNQAVA